MIYELRIYTVVPGRMADIEARFRDHLPELFKRHGINNAGRWKGLSGPGGPAWIYVMAYEDLAERTRQWASFYADQEWWAIRAQTNAGEEIVVHHETHFLSPNAAWAPAALTSQPGGIAALSLIELALGQKQATDSYIETVLIPAITAKGGKVAMVADFITGVHLPRLALMVSWKDIEAWRQGASALLEDPTLSEAFRSQRKQIGISLLGRTDSWVLQGCH